MLHKNTVVSSSDGKSEFFDIVAGILQVDTLTPYMIISYIKDVLWRLIHLIKENIFTLNKTKSRQYTAEFLKGATCK